MNYFPTKHSIHHYNQFNDLRVLEILANRFIADNPPLAYQLHAIDRTSHVVDEQGQVHLNFNDLLPEASIGAVAQSRALVQIHRAKSTTFKIKCYGPTRVFINDELVFSSSSAEENFRHTAHFQMKLKEKDNHLLIETEKTPLGFGVVIGNNMPQWESTHFFTPSGQAGFVSNLKGELPISQNKRVALETGTYIFKTTLHAQRPTTLSLPNLKSNHVSLNHRQVNPTRIEIPAGASILYVVHEGPEWPNLTLDYEAQHLMITSQVKGNSKPWIYAGPFQDSVDLKAFDDMSQLLPNDTYWTDVRPYQTSSLFGFWSYPMGVTLYGLLLAGRYFKNDSWIDYASQSLELICKWDSFAVNDHKNFAYTGINTQLYWLKELDDCGSFGSFMLECQKESNHPRIHQIGERIANFMMKEQRREADGAFSRHGDTMWIDDLYMCVPFLVRYWQTSNDVTYLNEAVQQLLLFKKRFFMADKKLMSHIFDPILEKANDIPWSRGNGWVIFSLSELLNVLPDNHEAREALVTFFNEMVSGILSLQHEDGLWHQVLDESDTYLESSSTAMFICALSRGIRHGYLDESHKSDAEAAVFRAWDGLQKIAIDCDGNLYGVCQGSSFSFSRTYYRNLLWRTNDPHGVGIVILAGVEKMQLADFLAS